MGGRPSAGLSRPTEDRARPRVPAASILLYGSLFLSAAWGAVVPFVAPMFGVRLDSATVARIADHVGPGVVALAAGLIAVVAEARRARVLPPVLFLAAVAGIWMTGAHVPLVQQAARGQATWPAAAAHGIPGVLIACSAGILLWRALLARDRDDT